MAESSAPTTQPSANPFANPTTLVRGLVVAVVLGLAVGAVLAAWGDLPAVWRVLTSFPPLLVVPVLGLTVWNYVLRWLKWEWYLRVLGVHGVSKTDSWLVFLSGFAMGMTPGKAGELTKSFWLREIAGAERAPLAHTAPIVFAERLTDGIAMLLLASAGLAAFQFGGGALLGVAVLAVLAVTLIQAEPLAHWGLRLLARLRFTRRIAEALGTAYDSARLLLTWKRLAIAVGVGVLSWGGECLALYVILLGLGAEPSLVLLNQATFALAAASILGSASLLPGGLGAAEGAVAGILELVAQQPRDVSVAATLLIRASTLWFGVLIGAAALPLLARRVLRYSR